MVVLLFFRFSALSEVLGELAVVRLTLEARVPGLKFQLFHFLAVCDLENIYLNLCFTL